MSDFRTEFPDYPVDQMPAMPAGFEDSSWPNDACPSFFNQTLRLAVFVDYPDRAKRERPDLVRFHLHQTDENGGRAPSGFEFESDDWNAILGKIAEFANWTPGEKWERIDTGGGLKPWRLDLASGHQAFLCDAEGGNLSSPFEPAAFSIWKGDDEQDVIIWNAAWEHARSKGLLLDDAGRAAIGARAARNNARTYAITKRIASGELSAEEGVAALLRKNGVDP